MNLNNLNMNAKIEELLSTLNKKEEEKEKNTVLWVLGDEQYKNDPIREKTGKER